MKPLLLALTGALVIGAAPLQPAQAEEFLTPDDVAWGMVLDPAKVHNSPLADQVTAYFTDEQRSRIGELIGGVSNTLGLDLQQDLGRIVVAGDGFAPHQMAMAVDIGSAQTNVAGLLLALENYDSYEYADLIIHSAKNADQPQFFCAVVNGTDTRPGLLLLSPDQSKTEDLVDGAQAGRRLIAPDALGDDAFFRLWIDRLPDDLFANQPRQSNIAGMIESLEIVGTTGETETNLTLNVTLTSPARAQQIYQMAAGGKALVEFAASSDPDAAKLADLLAYVRIEQPAASSNTFSIVALGDNESIVSILGFLEEEGAFKDLGL
ncbi:MAG: hypothetical protein AAGH99_16165 [Planctomycetota bacterium]